MLNTTLPRAGLTPGLGLHFELEHTLISKRALETLSDGTKVYTTPKMEKLLGGGQSHLEANRIFNAIIEQTNSLGSLPKIQALEVCVLIHSNINSLITYTNTALDQLVVKEENCEAKLISAEQEHATLCQKLEETRKSLNDLTGRLHGLQSRVEDLNREIERLNSEMSHLRRRIEEEETMRRDAVTDSIFLVGIIGGLITGHYKRMIPGYSQVAGIISAVNQDKEDCEHRLNYKRSERHTLNNEINSVSDEIRYKNQLIDNTERERSRLHSKITSKDDKIKQLGRSLTSLKNINLSLKILSGKYKFLAIDINLIKDYTKMDLLKATQISNFLIEITNTGGRGAMEP